MAGTGTPLVADANYLYKQLIDHINSVKELQSVIGDVGDEHLTTYNLFKQVAGFADPSHPKLEKKRVKGLMRHVFGDGSTKFGIVQRSLLGSPVDMVGRNVIVPNPDLDMDSIGIPVDSAFEIYKSLIIRKLTQRGYPLHKAKEAFENKEAAAKNTLLELTKERPVVMDRAPVLHKFGLMAFWPRLVKGDVLHVNPYVLGGFGADFDGDQNISYVYIRLSLELQDEMMRAKSVSCGFSKKCPSDNSFSAIISSSSSVIVAGEDKKIPILDEELMAGYRDLDVTVVDGEKKVVSICHLSDFPHAAKLYETQGQHGRIDWYAVPDGVEVLSYDEKNKIVVWTKPALFSVHHGCEIEIVTTSSGRQIITDDDPRAIYGFNLTTCEFDRNTPSEARRQQLMIPRARYIPGCEHVTHFNAVTFRSDNNYGHKLLNKIAMDFNLGYLLGVMIGDGWVSDNTGRVNSCQVYLADLKGEVAAKIDEIIKQYIPDTEVVRTVTDTTAGAYGKSIRHSWSATELGQFIKELVGHGCRHKNIPEWSLIAPVEYRQGLFAGLMDTDGGIGVSNAKAKNKPQLMANYTTVSLKLAQTVQVLAATLGIAAHITASKTPAGKPVWYVYFSSADIKRWGGYGLQTTEKRRKIEATPVDISSASLTRHDLVPMPFSLVEAVLKVIGAKKVIRTEEDGERKRLYMKLVATREGGKQQGRISRMVAIELRQILDKYRLVVNHPFWESWLQMCDNPFIVWEYVVDVEKTGQVETGYDLTVPGYETFADVNGVILSNTSNFQVPHSDEALQDAIELMMPSRNLIDPADNKSPAQSMTEDYILGLYDATRTPKNKPSVVRTFATKEDALRDFRRGNLGVHDTVRVLK
jgi:intein/homing endonuclease